MKTWIIREQAHAKSMLDYVRRHAADQARAGKPLVVTVAEHKARRSSEQNKKLHALLNDIAEQAVVNGRQYSAEVWKEQVRRRFIGTEELDMPDGTRIERGISTTALSVGEFANLIEAVTAWAQTELGVEA